MPLTPNLGNMSSLTTLGGQAISLNLDATGLHYNGIGRGVGDQVVASNGVLYVIDTVLQPQVNALAASELGSPQENIVQVLTDNGNFSTFLALVEQAGLLDELQDANSNFTIFAPTDEAFAAVQSDMMNEWTADPEGALNTILAYHIVTDQLTINQIANDDFLPTLEGRPLVITTGENKQVLINGHPVTTFNMRASNGVIHVVDSVLTP
jgi:transforming growth factor-beta-induced protein